MDIFALGAELPLQMTVDGQPALNCPIHGTALPMAALLDLSLDVLPCECPRADIAAYWGEQSPMLREWLKPDLDVLSELPDIPEQTKAPPAGETDGASFGSGAAEKHQNSENGEGSQ